MKWYIRSWERPRNRSASDALPSSVWNSYSLSIRTHGSSRRRRVTSSPRRVSSFSASSSSSRAASHSSRVAVVRVVISWFLSLKGGADSEGHDRECQGHVDRPDRRDKLLGEHEQGDDAHPRDVHDAERHEH